MEKKLEIPTPEAISAVRGEAGQSSKKVQSAMMEYATIPENGVFTEIGIKSFEIPKVGKKVAVGMFTKTGEFISENTIFSSTTLEEITQIKNGDNKDKFMLKQERNSPELFRLAASADKRLIALIGKQFTSKTSDGLTLKSYEAADMFATDKDMALFQLRKNIEPKKYYKFVVT